jgi:outer membrane protein assembly factor BamA
LPKTEPGLRIFFPFNISDPIPTDELLNRLFRFPLFALAMLTCVNFVFPAAPTNDAKDPVIDSQNTTIAPEKKDIAAFPKKIVSISFYGNIKTKENVLRMFLVSVGIDTGRIYDSTKVVYAKQKLRLTNLYSKVDIIPLVKEDGVHLFIILKEVFYLMPDGVGGERIERKHGKNIDWYRLHLGFTKYNFRGNMETFAIGTTLWDDRGISLSWSKPLFPSPYTISIGGATEYIPDNNYPQDWFIADGWFSISRRLTLHSKGGMGIIPTYTRINSTDGSIIMKYREVISSVNYGVDYRNDNYDPSRGWCFNQVVSTNSLFSDNVARFGQFRSDLRCYIPGLFETNRIAVRMQAVFRTNNAGNYKRLYLGGDLSVRGFPQLFLGMDDTMNDYAAISTEYRIHLWTTPLFDYGFLEDKFTELRGLFYEIEGALIVDAGHMWHDFPRPFDRKQTGAGIGAGLNIKAPILRTAGSFDVVWPISKQTDPAKAYYNKTVIYSQPTLHLYLSTF